MEIQFKSWKCNFKNELDLIALKDTQPLGRAGVSRTERLCVFIWKDFKRFVGKNVLCDYINLGTLDFIKLN